MVHPMEKKKLAIFDFDGTITSRDSMIEFVRYYRGDFALMLSYLILFPWLAMAKLGIYSREKAKKKFLRYHFGGEAHAELLRKSTQFCQRVMPAYTREKALEQLQFHKQHFHDVLIATASLDFWVEPWMKHMGLQYVCTNAEYVDGKFTGNFVTPNCSGEEKLRRIREKYNLDEYETIFGYGDTSEDKPFLKLAHKTHFRPFRRPVHKTVVE
jgi:phosphatidylglycerophosphatase C